MRNYFRPNKQPEITPLSHVELSPIEQAGLELLHSARISKREELESAAEAYVHRVEQESKAESLNHLLGTQARELQQLIKSTYAKENDFYYSRRGKKEAVRLIADQDSRLNPSLTDEQALSRAKSRYDMFKRLQGREMAGRRVGRAAIAPRLEMPAVCRVEGEFIGEDIYAEQFYKLEFAPLALKVNYVIADRHNPDNDASTEVYELSLPYMDMAEPSLISSEGKTVTDRDHYFVLGLMQETADYLRARAKLQKPPSSPLLP